MISDLQPDLSPSDDERQDSLFEMDEDWKKDWEGMPEFENKNLEPFKTVTVHFRNKEDYDQFRKLMDQNMTPEEAVWGYTVWAAYAAFLEDKTGTLERGKWADITVLDIDLLNVGLTDPARLFDGKVLMTMVNGAVVYESDKWRTPTSE